MAKIKLQGHASGTGVLTVTAPNTSTDRTITLPDETATLSTFNPDGAVTINDTGASVDFRVESNTDANCLIVDGSGDAVGIGTAVPAEKLHIVVPGSSTTTVTGIKIANDADTSGENVGISFGSPSWGDGAAIYAKDLSDDGKCDLGFAVRLSGAPTERLTIKSDGRGLSQFTAKAWANFNGTGTPAFRDSHNFSSITDTTTGTYRVNFTNAMANTNYCAFASGDAVVTWQGAGTHANSTTTGYVGIKHVENNINQDTALNSVLVFGD